MGRIACLRGFIEELFQLNPRLELEVRAATVEIREDREIEAADNLNRAIVCEFPQTQDQGTQTDPIPVPLPPPTAETASQTLAPTPRGIKHLTRSKTKLCWISPDPPSSAEEATSEPSATNFPPTVTVPLPIPPLISTNPGPMPRPLYSHVDLNDATRVGCWNCEDPRHDFPHCPHQQLRKFCKRCGWRGVKISECPKCSADWRHDPRRTPARVSRSPARASRSPARVAPRHNPPDQPRRVHFAEDTEPSTSTATSSRTQRGGPYRRSRDLDPSPRRFDFVRPRR